MLIYDIWRIENIDLKCISNTDAFSPHAYIPGLEEGDIIGVRHWNKDRTTLKRLWIASYYDLYPLPMLENIEPYIIHTFANFWHISGFQQGLTGSYSQGMEVMKTLTPPLEYHHFYRIGVLDGLNMQS